MVNWYEAKIHLPNKSGSFIHNDMNWFCLYKLYKKGADVYKENVPQIAVFMTDTEEGKSDFFLIPDMYKQSV